MRRLTKAQRAANLHDALVALDVAARHAYGATSFGTDAEYALREIVGLAEEARRAFEAEAEPVTRARAA